jgi:hypothetical protein
VHRASVGVGQPLGEQGKVGIGQQLAIAAARRQR